MMQHVPYTIITVNSPNAQHIDHRISYLESNSTVSHTFSKSDQLINKLTN